MIGFLILVQAAAPAPDIELDIRARARSVEIERKGEAKLEARGEGPGSRVEARVEPAPEGRTTLRNVEIRVRAEAFVADPAAVRLEAETVSPE